MIFRFGKKKSTQEPQIDEKEKVNVGDNDQTKRLSGGKTKRRGLLSRLTTGLARSSARLTSGLKVFSKRKLDVATIQEFEDMLVSADLGVTVAKRITGELAKKRLDKEIEDQEIRKLLAEQLSIILKKREKRLDISSVTKPCVILFVGVNGSGKTTTIGKISSQIKASGKKVMLVAGDTFRAAAVEQLYVWGKRTGVPVEIAPQGADASGLVYGAISKAKAQNVDVVLIDTAGRLQNRSELMSELSKLLRVARKVDPQAPHEIILVLDATVGQNALRQVEAFKAFAEITGLIMTKLDGTAKGGILVAIAQQYDLPIHYIGVGEGEKDMKRFDAEEFAVALTDVTETKG